jgi:ferredoxin-NADP reductase/predicted transcriptional regulator
MKNLMSVLLALAFSLGLLSAAPASAQINKCADLFKKERIEDKTLEVDSRTYYQKIMSTDLDFLRDEAKFAEGAAPQRNVSIVPHDQQFRINGEVEPILRLKKKLMKRFKNRIIKVQKGYAADILTAVREQFAMILTELPVKYPAIYRREGGTLIVIPTGDRLSGADLATVSATDALEKLGSVVPDDIVFMKKVGEEYHVIGGNLAFPTHWSLEGALNATISEIHSDLGRTPQDPANVVPEKAKAFSLMINRVLDRTLMTTDVVRRNNWFIEYDPRYPLPAYQRSAYVAPARIDAKNYRENTFVRTERQTMRGLPQSQTVAFSLQPMVFSLAKIHEDPSVAQNLLEGIKVKLLPQKERNIEELAKYLEADVSKNLRKFDTKVVSSLPVNETINILRVAKPAGVTPVVGEAVKVTLTTAAGKVSRTLSLASSPEREFLEFAVRDSESDFKTTLKALKPGDGVSLELTGTSLGFKMDKPMVMIAGGIGITPFRSAIQYMHDKKITTPTFLFYGNRDHIAFGEELDHAASENAALNITHVLSRDENAQVKGRIDEALLQKIVPQLPADAVYYVVATPQMTSDIELALGKLGIPKERISIEAFPGYESNATVSDPNAPKKPPGDDDMICYCHRVKAGAIRSAIQGGADTLEQIQAQTKASTGCGGCKCNVLQILSCGVK